MTLNALHYILNLKPYIVVFQLGWAIQPKRMLQLYGQKISNANNAFWVYSCNLIWVTAVNLPKCYQWTSCVVSVINKCYKTAL